MTPSSSVAAVRITPRSIRSFAAVLALGALPAPARAQFPPDSFENLKVLPKDIKPRELVNQMRGFASALGVRCTHCHVGKEGEPLETYDFASDEKPTKLKAREMLRMVKAINEQHLAKLEDRAEPRIAVECATCHRGVAQPRPIQGVLLAAYDARGIDSAIVAYRALRERYYGRASYDFGAPPLVTVARAVEEKGAYADALRLLEMNAELLPDAPQAQTEYVTAAVKEAFATRGIGGGTAFYRELKQKRAGSGFSQATLNNAGYRLLELKRPVDAVAVFELNVAEYPEWNSYDSLGEGYAAAGDKRRARESYEKSLQLNPKNENARKKLAELR